MFKTFIFARGLDSPLKRSLVERLLEYLGGRVLRLSIWDYSPIDRYTMKLADKSCKGIIRGKLVEPQSEHFFLIDNESLLPQHWLSYLNLGDPIGVQTLGVGLDVVDENLNTEANKVKLNLQDQKLPLFIATMYKYVRVQSDTDIPEVLREIKPLFERV